MARKWRHFFGRTPGFPALAPAENLAVIGDIHGRADLLRRLPEVPSDTRIICVGDYVDRGDESAEVLRMLHGHPDLICLSGNHEEMLLRFIKDPGAHGTHWLRYGGLQTLASFGVSGITETSDAKMLVTARDQLVAAMGCDILNWLKSLPRSWQSGNVAIVHAGADPAKPLQHQSTKDLHWGHPDFGKTQRDDGIWIVHGHTIVDMPKAQNGVISIDTGAYATGRLTCAHIRKANVSFETIT